MKIKRIKVKVKDLFDGFDDKGDEGVFAYGGKLNVRPAYQREFIYNQKQQVAVIESVKKEYPLNTIYWAKNNDGTYEVIDGQQRTMSICKYLNGDYPVSNMFYYNLHGSELSAIDNYEIDVCVCEGSATEKLEWFNVINIGGVVLEPQELRNASYTGTWLSDLKNHFSKLKGDGVVLAEKVMKYDVIRQEMLEKVLKGISESQNMTIDDYMAKHQNDSSAIAEWNYFQDIIHWIKKNFPITRPLMYKVDWFKLFNKYGGKTYDANTFEEQIKKLMTDEDIRKQSGIYEYLLSGDEKVLQIRAFEESVKNRVLEAQGYKCKMCGADLKDVPSNMREADHIKPWVEGGKTVEENCQILCRDCNRKKSDK